MRNFQSQKSQPSGNSEFRRFQLASKSKKPFALSGCFSFHILNMAENIESDICKLTVIVLYSMFVRSKEYAPRKKNEIFFDGKLNSASIVIIIQQSGYCCGLPPVNDRYTKQPMEILTSTTRKLPTIIRKLKPKW